MDETSINFSQRFKSKVIVTQNTHQVLCAQPDRITSCTLVLGIAAAGEALQSTLIWPQASVPDEFSLFCLKRIRILCNKAGWQTRQTFEEMMLHYYIPEMERRRREIHANSSPILLYLDGHSSRLSIEFIRECIRKSIIVAIFPAHSSSHSQPLDNGPNGVLKNEFCKLAASKLNQRMIGTDVTEAVDTGLVSEEFDEENMPPLPKDFQMSETGDETNISASFQRKLIADALPVALEYALLSSVVLRAWRKTGLEPFDPDVVLRGLATGPEIKRCSNYPSISGTILTSTSSVLSVWQWKSEKDAKELQKAKEETLKSKLRDEIDTLTLEARGFRMMLREGDGSTINGDERLGLKERIEEARSGNRSDALESRPAETIPSQTLPPQRLPAQPLPAQTLPSQTLPIQPLPPQTLPPQTLPSSSLNTLPLTLNALSPAPTLPVKHTSKILPTAQAHAWTTPKRLLPLTTLISPSADLFYDHSLTKKSIESSKELLTLSHRERIRMDTDDSDLSQDNLNSTNAIITDIKDSIHKTATMQDKPKTRTFKKKRENNTTGKAQMQTQTSNPDNNTISDTNKQKIAGEHRSQRTRKMKWNPDYIYSAEFYMD